MVHQHFIDCDGKFKKLDAQFAQLEGVLHTALQTLQMVSTGLVECRAAVGSLEDAKLCAESVDEKYHSKLGHILTMVLKKFTDIHAKLDPFYAMVLSKFTDFDGAAKRLDGDFQRHDFEVRMWLNTACDECKAARSLVD